MEIERKFLTVSEAWRTEARACFVIRQGYLTADPERVVRVRTKGTEAFLTIKSAAHPGAGALVRDEFEYPLPLTDATALLDHLCLAPTIEKRRHIVPGPDGKHWEVDEYVSPQAGLVVAEIELATADEPFAAPSWLGREVTHDPRYLSQRIAGVELKTG